MPEPFKNAFNLPLITGMADHFHQQWPEFDMQGFTAAASKDLDALELKARSEQIMFAMIDYLPADFSRAAEMILATLSPAHDGDIFGELVDEHGISGWAIMPMAHYVGLRGHDHFETAMNLFKELTKRFSSEFAVRLFLLQEPEKTWLVMKQWTQDSDKHVRRLASEGIRPRLPWAMRLTQFINDPSPVIELLELLKDDRDAYVRRSVANNLNDIAKDHPELVADIAEQWMQGASKQRRQLVRHACRSLLKQGNAKVLQLFGYGELQLEKIRVLVQTPVVEFGMALQFSLSINSTADHDQPLMIDYVIHHQKANGKTSAKVFKWRTTSLAAKQSLCFSKTHAMRKITTRVYYPGLHRLEVMVNGIIVGSADFQLEM